MVLVTKNTRCRLCGELMGSSEIMTLPSFPRNRSDRLAPFSGGAIHPKCFDEHPLSALAQEFSDRRRRHAREPCRCVVCGDPVLEGPGNDGLTTSLLSTEEDHPLFAYNFTCIHREHLEDWSQLAEFRQAVARAIEAGRWRGEPFVRRTQLPEGR